MCLIFRVCCLPREGSCRGNGKRLYDSSERQEAFGVARRPGALARGVTGSDPDAGASEQGSSSSCVAEGQGLRRLRLAVTKGLRLLCMSVGLGSSARQTLVQSSPEILPLPLTSSAPWASCRIFWVLPLTDIFRPLSNSSKVRELALMIHIIPFHWKML